jgi:hypothetical protein
LESEGELMFVIIIDGDHWWWRLTQMQQN